MDPITELMRMPFTMAQATIDQMMNTSAAPMEYSCNMETCDCESQPVEADQYVPGVFGYSGIANGPVEEVLAFNNDEFIRLKGLPDAPYFSSHGPLTDLHGKVLRGSRVETTFPVDPTSIDNATFWPTPQVPPFDSPPLNESGTTGHGYSKQAYFLSKDDSFVTVGPSLPKIATLKNGGAQFWVGSIGVIAQGTGRFEHVRGVTTYVGSGYLPVWPSNFDDQAQILQAGFRALVGTYVKIVFERDHNISI